MVGPEAGTRGGVEERGKTTAWFGDVLAGTNDLCMDEGLTGGEGRGDDDAPVMMGLIGMPAPDVLL